MEPTADHAGSGRYGTFQEANHEPESVDVQRILEEEQQRLERDEQRWIVQWRVAIGTMLALAAVLVVGRVITHPDELALPPSAVTTAPSVGNTSLVRSVKIFPGSSANRTDVRAEFAGGVEESTAQAYVVNSADAWATFNDSLHETGWSQLWVQTATLLPEEAEDRALGQKRRVDIMFAAGYAEGALTHHRIDQHYANVLATLFPNAVKGDAAELQVLANVRQFLQQNLDWLRSQIAYYHEHPDQPEAPYWAAMEALVAQFDGLAAGYHAFSSETPISTLDLFMLNAGGDMEDLISMATTREHVELAPVTASLYSFIKNLKCSALIRILPGFQDLLWGHATWDAYSAMNRVFKHAELPAFDGGERRKTSMSSFPGYLSSIDDWYMTSSGLAVMETTNGVFEPSLYAAVTPKSVLSWLRSKVANHVAPDGEAWVAAFSKYNSGTYNNQWMVIDTKRFVVGEGFQRNGLTVLEQLPGLIHAEDLSEAVNSAGYWASYNVPYFPTIYTRSGYLDAFLASNDSESWSHSNCSRALIFERDAPTVQTMEDLKRVMRYNDWREDPLSEDHASHAVAARFDLETDPALASLEGAVDAKVTSLELFSRLECDAVSGPTHAQNPVFEWTPAARAQAPHAGLPPRYDFDFERMQHARHMQPA